MPSRRDFLARVPLGLGALAACGDASQTAGAQTRVAPPPSGAPQQPLAAPQNGSTLQFIPKHEELVYTFGGNKPLHRIQPNTRIISWAEDCFDGAVKTIADLPSKVVTPGHDNPQTGPFYIEGAEAGDTLALHLIKTEPARDYAVGWCGPMFGALVGTDRTALILPDLPETVWRYDVDVKANIARTKSRDGKHTWEVPLAPFLGCLGVAPAMAEVRSTIVPGPFGGNMDCPEVKAGNTVFLGVNVSGALMSFGDGHYAMGDGEITGAAIEGAMNVELIVELIKKKFTPVPRIENSNEVMFVGSGRPLEDTARMAFKAMVHWVRDHSGLSELDAYQFVSQNVTAPIIQLVDPEYTVLVKLDKRRLPRP
jgi:acetamidase/formamidase